MINNKISILILGFVLGAYSIYIYNTLSETKIVFKNDMPIHQDTLMEENKTIVNKKEKIPSFVKYALQELNISSTSLTKESWEIFLKKVQVDGYSEIMQEYANEGEYTLIHLLASIMAIGPIEKLVEKGLDINAKTKRGNTPLMLAIKKVNLDTIKTLIDMGADIAIKDNNGLDVLNYALRNGFAYEKKKIIDFLLEDQGFDFANNPKQYLDTMVMFPNNEEYILKTLPHLDKKEYRKYMQKLFEEREVGNDKILDFFIDNMSDMDIDMLNSVTKNKNVSTRKLQTLIDKYSLDINMGDKEKGDMPLMHAVARGDVDKVEFYLKNGANPDLISNIGHNSFSLLILLAPIHKVPEKARADIKNLLDEYAGRL